MKTFVTLLLVSAVLVGACESPGYTPDCPPMPVTKDGPNSPELVAWRKEAVPKGCATAAYDSDDAGGSAGSGSAGSGSGGADGSAGAGD